MTAMLLRLHLASARPTRWMALSTGVLLLATAATAALVAARSTEWREIIAVAAWPAAVALVWTAIAVQLLLPESRRRASVFLMTLPVSGRRLWLASQLSALSAASVTAAVMLGTLAGADRLLALRMGGLLFGGEALLLQGLVAVLAAALLAVAMLHLPGAGEQFLPLRGWYLAYGLGATLLPGVLLLVFRDWPLAFAGACAAAATGGLMWGYGRQPEAMLLEERVAASTEGRRSLIPAWGWLTAVRWTIGLPVLSASMATAMGFGVLQAVLSYRHAEEDETGLLMMPMLIYILLVWLPAAGRYLHRLAPIPIPAWKTTAMVTVPVLGAALFGYGTAFSYMALQNPAILVEFQTQPGRGFPLQKSERPLLRVPANYFEIAWNGQAPELRAPWGESHKPWQARIFRGMNAVLYSPVSTAEQTTAEFAAWEISNGLAMVYGVRVAPEQIQASHLRLAGGGQPVLTGDLGVFVPEGAKPVSALYGAIPPLTVAVCGATYLALAGLLFGLRRLDSPAWKRTAVVGGVMAGLLLAYLIRVPLSFSGLSRGWILGGAVSSLARSVAAATPGGATTLWILSGVLVLGAFRFAAVRLAQAEILPEPRRRFGF